MSRILVTGASGQLGHAIAHIARIATHDHAFIFADHSCIDVTRPGALFEFYARQPFDWCVNAAAYTNVDGAESNREAARLVNAIAPALLAVDCAQLRVPLVHLSTDFVFDGNERDRPYGECDAPNPLSEYGRTKLDGERAVSETHRQSIIIRTSWLHSPWGKNFVKTILRLANERDQLSIVNDQIGSPTYAFDLARAILRIIDMYESVDHDRRNEMFGLYHFSNAGHISWYEFACRIVEVAELKCDVVPIATADYPLPARRPYYSVLGNEKMKAVFDIEQRSWSDGVDECVRFSRLL